MDTALDPPRIGEPGYRVGDDRSPDTYELRRHVRDGGEGELWEAVSIRQDGLTDSQWAVKILHARNLVDQHDETLGKALDEWHERQRNSLREAAQLQRDVPGIVGPADIFTGSEPHPPGETGKRQALYVVSPWIDGDDLTRWRQRRRPSFEEVCDLAQRLATIVDSLADRNNPVVHRDISPANVIRGKDGRVHLIDLTFARPPNSAAGTKMVSTPGYTAPEAHHGEVGFPADRYSFGAVVYYLLIGQAPPPTGAAEHSREELIRERHGTEVADHVAALLRAQPRDRPTSLTAWTARLRVLGSRAPVPLGYRDVALTIDGTAAPVVTAASTEGTFSVRLGVGMSWRLRRDPASPAAVTAVTAVTDGSGTPVTFAIDETGTVHVGRAGTWTAAGQVVGSAGIAAIRDAQGTVSAFAIDPAGDRLATITVRLDGSVHRVTSMRPARRVLAATNDRDGSTVVLLLSPGNDLVCLSASGATRIAPGGALAAAICLDRLGELRCYCASAGRDVLVCYDQPAGAWGPAWTVDVPITPIDVACAGHRDGVTVAIGGPGGLWVATQADTQFSPWQPLTDTSCQRVVLDTGAAWRLRLAALAEGRVSMANEDFNGTWSMGLTTL